MINASLGAHYSNRFIWLSLKQLVLASLGINQPQYLEKLTNLLTDFFPGKVEFVYKGRDAIELCLRQYGITNRRDGVITQAFTCSAIEEGIVRAGATPIYADLGHQQLNLNTETLEQAKNNQPNLKIKAVLVQHSLGHPAEIKAIKNWCQKNQVLLIEDLAQSFGATDSANNLLGKNADAIILSFGRDKIIDAVTGGAVIFCTQPQNYQPKKFALPSKKIIIKDLSYPVLTWLIRQTYHLKIGKIIHFLLKKTHWFYSPIKAPTKQITRLPSYFVQLALLQLIELDTNHQHRQKISEFYLEELTNLPIQLFTTQQNLEKASLLRFAFTTPHWSEIMTDWQQHQIHLADRWYRQPVDCGQLHCSRFYQEKSCPNAEKISQQILNLPTHRQISLKAAKKIVAIIKKHVN